MIVFPKVKPGNKNLYHGECGVQRESIIHCTVEQPQTSCCKEALVAAVESQMTLSPGQIVRLKHMK